ncbi:MAG: transglutaminase domain-containing protein, partial [Deltaproteobacteria bacterium]|nr:transglutaminase domain-containing protein [Deltaproteobacteria bacterium]
KRSEIVAKLLTRIKKDIRIQKEVHYSAYITPTGVYELGISDKGSRNIFFLAVCRSLGIPARLEEITKTPQYFDLEKWINIYPDKDEQKQLDIGYFFLEPKDENNTLPLYYQHFTVAKLDYNTGLYRTLDYEWKAHLSDFSEKLKVETGRYRLITGNRRTDGAAFIKVSYFTVEKDKTTKVDFKLNSLKRRGKPNKESFCAVE